MEAGAAGLLGVPAQGDKGQGLAAVITLPLVEEGTSALDCRWSRNLVRTLISSTYSKSSQSNITSYFFVMFFILWFLLFMLLLWAVGLVIYIIWAAGVWWYLTLLVVTFVCRMMEPQCFSLSATPPKTCGPPPTLRNGYIQVRVYLRFLTLESCRLFGFSDVWQIGGYMTKSTCSQNPRDFYLVGNTVEYSCIEGHYLSGSSVAQCTENQKWATEAMVCKSMSSP